MIKDSINLLVYIKHKPGGELIISINKLNNCNLC